MKSDLVRVRVRARVRVWGLGLEVEREYHRGEGVALLGRLHDEPGQLLPVHAVLARGADQVEKRVDLHQVRLDKLRALPILRLLIAQLLHARLLRLTYLVNLGRVRVRVRIRVRVRVRLGVRPWPRATSRCHRA